MSHKQAKEERKQAMNEFQKKTGPVPGKGPLPIIGQQPTEAYKLEILFNAQGQVVGVVGPTNMPLPVVVDHLAAGIQSVAREMAILEQKKESRIVVPQMVGVKPLS